MISICVECDNKKHLLIFNESFEKLRSEIEINLKQKYVHTYAFSRWMVRYNDFQTHHNHCSLRNFQIVFHIVFYFILFDSIYWISIEIGNQLERGIRSIKKIVKYEKKSENGEKLTHEKHVDFSMNYHYRNEKLRKLNAITKKK